LANLATASRAGFRERPFPAAYINPVGGVNRRAAAAHN